MEKPTQTEHARQPESQQEMPQFSWRPKEGTPQIYTNYVQVSWTLFDVRFVLGQLVPAQPGSREFVIEERGAVTFAWPEAKAIRNIITDLVNEYEKANGEIKSIALPTIPDSLKPPVKTKNE